MDSVSLSTRAFFAGAGEDRYHGVVKQGLMVGDWLIIATMPGFRPKRFATSMGLGMPRCSSKMVRKPAVQTRTTAALNYIGSSSRTTMR